MRCVLGTFVVLDDAHNRWCGAQANPNVMPEPFCGHVGGIYWAVSFGWSWCCTTRRGTDSESACCAVFGIDYCAVRAVVRLARSLYAAKPIKNGHGTGPNTRARISYNTARYTLQLTRLFTLVVTS